MSMIRHRYPAYQKEKPRADRITVFLLVLVIVAVFMALSFGDAVGTSFL